MTLDTMQAVVNDLQSRKVEVVLEYPGVIRVGRMCIGDVDDTIDANIYETADLDQIGLNLPTETIESDIPSKSTDVERISNFIYHVVQAAKEANAPL